MTAPTGRAVADIRLQHHALSLLVECDASARSQARSGKAVPPDEAADLAAYRARLVQLAEALGADSKPPADGGRP